MSNIISMDMNLLVVFDALFDERSVTRAADRLALTQPTVSGLLQRLRQSFADQLFVRTSHGILPTPRAEALAGPIKDLLANVRSLTKAEPWYRIPPRRPHFSLHVGEDLDLSRYRHAPLPSASRSFNDDLHRHFQQELTHATSRRA